MKSYDVPPREMAFRIAVRFPNRAPSAAEIMAEFPELSKATAHRYARDYHRAWQPKAA